jgi:hypothetical protein
MRPSATSACQKGPILPILMPYTFDLPEHNTGAKETFKSFARLASAGVPSRAPSSGVLSRTPSSAVSSVAAQSSDVSTSGDSPRGDNSVRATTSGDYSVRALCRPSACSGDSPRGDLRPPAAHSTHARRQSSR